MGMLWRSVGLGASVALLVIAAVLGYQHATGSTYRVPPPGDQYTNTTHRFTFTVPKGFQVREEGNTVVLSDSKGNGLQIVITPLNRDIEVLDEARIRADLPALTIINPQAVSIAGAGTGLAFISDNAAFDGASREVWFVEDGSLYQIITYEHLGPLLNAVFGTLQFL